MGSAIPYVVGGEGLAHRWRTLGAGFLRYCGMGWRVSRKGLAQGVGAAKNSAITNNLNIKFGDIHHTVNTRGENLNIIIYDNIY